MLSDNWRNQETFENNNGKGKGKGKGKKTKGNGNGTRREFDVPATSKAGASGGQKFANWRPSLFPERNEDTTMNASSRNPQKGGRKGEQKRTLDVKKNAWWRNDGKRPKHWEEVEVSTHTPYSDQSDIEVAEDDGVPPPPPPPRPINRFRPPQMKNLRPIAIGTQPRQLEQSAQASAQSSRPQLSPPETRKNLGFNTRTTDTTRQFLTDARFEDLRIDPKMKKALREVMHYENMTEVQKTTLPILLDGHDVFSRAKTGTGKTLAFLIPTVEKIITRSRPAVGITSLVMSPTRELAMQIYEECRALTKFIPNFQTAIVFGGTNMNADKKHFTHRVDLLVATPGRLLDHLENTDGFADKVRSLHSLILDEADQLLEVGFRDAITNIVQYLPTERQSLLFSATVAQNVRNVAQIALNEKYQFVDCVGDDDECTVKQAKQTLIVRELDESFSALISLVQKAKQEYPSNFKVVVFFITARQTQFSAEAINNLPGFDVIEIHSRKSQAVRTKASDKFRNAKSGILFSSDVSARGLDYPNVTHVIQVGAPSSREQYIHRLGRAARAGGEGEGVLILHPWEQYFVKIIEDLPLERSEGENLDRFAVDDSRVKNAITRVSLDTRQKCYSAWLGYYNGLCPKRIHWSKPELVQWVNWYATEGLHLEQLPIMEKKTIGKMGLKGVPGLRTS